MDTISKLLASCKSQITASWHCKDATEKLFAAKSVGEVEGYLKCMKDNKLITPEEYADAFDKMTKLWSRL